MVHTKRSMIFSAIQNHLAWTKYALGCFGQDQISRIIWQETNDLWMFWTGPDIKDLLAWTKCLMDVVDTTKCLLTKISFSSLAALRTKISLVCFVGSLPEFKS